MRRCILALLAPLTMWAGMIHLINDSPYPLRARIRGGDGSFLGEMVLNAYHSATWTDFNLTNPNGAGLEKPSYSQTPYTVMWECMGGQDFSVCYQIPQSGTVTAFSCPGARSCPNSAPPNSRQNPTEENGNENE